MKALILVLTISFSAKFACAQPPQWMPIDTSYEAWGVYDLYYSQNLEMTILCGLFQAPESPYLGGFNGSLWISLADIQGAGIRTAVDFEDGILIGGEPFFLNNQLKVVSYYNGDDWTFPWAFDQSITKLKWVNDTLFALGWFETVDGDSIWHVAKLVDDSWIEVFQKPDTLEWAAINDIEFFEGAYYLGGRFFYENSIKGLMKIENGTLVEATDQLVIGPWNGVGHLNIYQGELYISGGIPGVVNPGNGIVRWDGELLRDVGCYFYEIPQDLSYGGGVIASMVIGDYLYAGGYFRFCDDFELFELGRWDGNQWCSLYMMEFDQPELEFEQRLVELGHFQDQLMIIRVFRYDETEFDEFWLYQGGDQVETCTELLTITEKSSIAFQLFPNPAQTHVSIQAGELITSFRLYNSMGAVVKSAQPFSERLELDLSGLAAGIYLVEVQTEMGVGVEKLVVEK